MNLREAYQYIHERKLHGFIRTRRISVTNIKFMLGDVVYREVSGDNPYCIDRLLNIIKGEIISRYITNEIRLNDNDFHFRISDIEGKTFDIY